MSVFLLGIFTFSKTASEMVPFLRMRQLTEELVKEFQDILREEYDLETDYSDAEKYSALLSEVFDELSVHTPAN